MTVNLIGRYSLAGEIVLEGCIEAITLLAGLLSHPDESGSHELGKPISSDPRPYDGYVNIINFIINDSCINIYNLGESVFISGSIKNFYIMKSEILAFINSYENKKIKNYHKHIEYYEDHQYLCRNSKPLVILIN